MGVHFDSKNAGLDAICTIGEYEGGLLVLPSLGIVLNSSPNTLIFLRSKDHPHFVTNYQGKRFSLVAYSHQSNNQAIGAQQVNGSVHLEKFAAHLPLIAMSSQISKNTSLCFSN